MTTLAEFMVTTDGRKDFYNVRNVDGFNLPMSIIANSRESGCKPTICFANVNLAYLEELQKQPADGNVVACESVCFSFQLGLVLLLW